jgi:hypothetical protein
MDRAAQISLLKKLAHYHKWNRRALGLPVDDGPAPVREAAE